ncbi:NDR1/HIN1-like protein 12 [Cornus florida]|uniref:NDR1/HIN1-like protein 12 n=1 Tax=Cornus florida TaxID=4283 RepID=UPI0028975D1C|nr:NDR1/HIN1-like protein 12 [Cornus florida]
MQTDKRSKHHLPMQTDKRSKRSPYHEKHTNPLIWLLAIICTVLAVAVIVTGLIVFVGYEIIKPKVPSFSVAEAHLDLFDYSQAGLLTTEVNITTKFENHNAKAHASFYQVSLLLSFYGTKIAKLVAEPFDVSKNSSIELNYLVDSSPIPLGPAEQDYVDRSIKQGSVIFELKGNARTRWRIGLLGSVKFWLHLNCELHFFFINGTATTKHCSSKST